MIFFAWNIQTLHNDLNFHITWAFCYQSNILMLINLILGTLLDSEFCIKDDKVSTGQNHVSLSLYIYIYTFIVVHLIK